ncbi:hypothetical protein Sros_4518 [Streptosporangium roseum DSM 43021]|uniref:Uncharacterized protein n=1 Tax=Streptosporangium roseum (strain ATCC 12428 / DSM 43021 / JCM 3005 / KCTC 9067 / NCIMB 10171 / NRRL 2505 / NI 9100) TaxID=479432 RepID=D2B1T1_STRRD|nr:hypothetical protein Sros_4518 [Streptosporangium roseum DSM 43021]
MRTDSCWEKIEVGFQAAKGPDCGQVIGWTITEDLH